MARSHVLSAATEVGGSWTDLGGERPPLPTAADLSLQLQAFAEGSTEKRPRSQRWTRWSLNLGPAAHRMSGPKKSPTLSEP